MVDDQGMMPAEEWAETAAHANSSYSCGKCGESFASPHEVYAHLAAEHPRPQGRKS